MARRRGGGGRRKRRQKLVSGAFSSALFHIPEPDLTFAFGQSAVDPRDGLMLFGPLDDGAPYGVRVGVVGTATGIAYIRSWLQRMQGVQHDKNSGIARPPFLGFETIFRVQLAQEPAIALEVPAAILDAAVRIDDKHQRVYQTVGLFTDAILTAHREDEAKVDVWFVVIPEEVHTYCRPRSVVPTSIRIEASESHDPHAAKALLNNPSFFDDVNESARPYHYEVDFHNQLKARLLEARVLTQIVRESTIAVNGVAGVDRPKRDNLPFQAAVAWNLATAAFYKAGGRPWRIAGVRKGVCYLGLVFKQDHTRADSRMACCAAQMFLDSGDGLVFKGALGPWYNPKMDEYHLDKDAACELVRTAIAAYERAHSDPPTELFIHGQTHFSEEEWNGFVAAVGKGATRVVCVKIRTEASFRLYRPISSRPVLRGLAYILHPKAGYLWTRGYAPRLRSYAGREVPRPLRVDIVHGETDLRVVLRDVLALTKLNYNACMLGDGLPVTLRFADAIGEILTAAPSVAGSQPLPFRHYI
jgi:hypothetical protein